MLDKDTQPYGSITQPCQINALAVVEMSQMARRALDFSQGKLIPTPHLKRFRTALYPQVQYQ